MSLFIVGSISRKLAFLVILAVLPALAIILYSGIEDRQHVIEIAKRKMTLLTHTMAEAQKETARSVKEILSIISRLSAIQDMDPQKSGEILRAVVKTNTKYNNMALVDLNGDVVASNRTFTKTNLADRKHVRDALEQKKFAVGEFIISRIGVTVPVFAFAYPILSKEGLPKGVLTAVIKLDSFSNYLDISSLPDKSFVAITDYKGIRLSYYPPQVETNPIGKAISAESWGIASKKQEPGMFINTGSDGRRRIFSFEQVRLNTGETPYLYVWTGIPEDHILKPANTVLIRNLLLMAIAAVLAVFISWLVGKNIESLIEKLEQALNEIKKQKEELKELASTDPLTGIANRRECYNHLKITMARAERYPEDIALLMLDIDHFKTVNDTYGHDAGDKILVELVQQIKSTIRQVDMLVRWGGEEFMILLPETNTETAHNLAERIRHHVEKFIFCQPQHITVSIGLTTLQKGDSLESFTKRADDALYQAKDAGRNCVITR